MVRRDSLLPKNRLSPNTHIEINTKLCIGNKYIFLLNGIWMNVFIFDRFHQEICSVQHTRYISLRYLVSATSANYTDWPDQRRRRAPEGTAAEAYHFQSILGRTTPSARANSTPITQQPLKYIIRPCQYSVGSFWSIITYQIHTGPYTICGGCQYTSKQWYCPSRV